MKLKTKLKALFTVLIMLIVMCFSCLTAVSADTPFNEPPTNFKAVLYENGVVKLSWDDVENADFYRIARAELEEGPYLDVDYPFPGMNAFFDYDVDDGATYYYQIHAYKNESAGPSAFTSVTVSSYTITASAGENGTITPQGNIVANHGTDSTFNFMPEEGYEIDKLFIDDIETPVSGNSYTFNSINQNHKIHVTFKSAFVNINATTDGNGSIDPEGITTIPQGENQTFTFSPNEYYEVDKILIDDEVTDVEGNTYTFSNLQKDATIHVTFKDTRSNQGNTESGSNNKPGGSQKQEPSDNNNEDSTITDTAKTADTSSNPLIYLALMVCPLSLLGVALKKYLQNQA